MAQDAESPKPQVVQAPASLPEAPQKCPKMTAAFAQIHIFVCFIFEISVCTACMAGIFHMNLCNDGMV